MQPSQADRICSGTKGVHVLTLSELLSLKLNGVHLPQLESMKKLHNENDSLRKLISNLNMNTSGSSENNDWRSTLIRCLADIFSNEQQRRLNDLSMNDSVNQKTTQLEQEIHHMCDYQRDALDKLFNQERLSLMKELNDTKQQLVYMREQFKQIQQNLKQDLQHNDQNKRLILSSTPYDDDINSFIYDKKIPYEYQQRILKLYLKYLKTESYRKALIYQKRYLLILLSGYEDTEKYALNEIKRLGQNVIIPTISTLRYGRQQYQSRKYYSWRTNNLLFLFRSRVRVVIAIIRMKYLINKWRQKLALR
ncbi:unnamed protein product [Didymodactylos carnosus]|uniref:Pericentrin/AKAP-450 centrosomal targeting domain-containing protein n=2 Tax=Didymodactylos carnosus TaxID=1234261 RepID=A0A813YWN0_9BILA|nr:unnamed protein product [Didymodactylos carnosus]CAF3675215.1 unnamed protein product [Didymodactylos carnosus]